MWAMWGVYVVGAFVGLLLVDVCFVNVRICVRWTAIRINGIAVVTIDCILRIVFVNDRLVSTGWRNIAFGIHLVGGRSI